MGSSLRQVEEGNQFQIPRRRRSYPTPLWPSLLKMYTKGTKIRMKESFHFETEFAKRHADSLKYTHFFANEQLA